MTGDDNKTISYCSPAHGGWGIVRMGMLVPESYQLFVCPFACGRHGAIGAITHGNKERLSYLYIDEADIVSGGYEDLIVDSALELLDILDYTPRVLMIFVSCIDDLLGTDHEAFLNILREKRPDIHFTVGHMNPLSTGGKLPPPINIQCKMYGLLEKTDKTSKSVNIIGHSVTIDENSEIYSILNSRGYEVKQLSACMTFDEFQTMAESMLNIVIRPNAIMAAKDMQKKLGIDYIYMPLSYDLHEIEEGYNNLSNLFFCGQEIDLSAYKQAAEEAIEKLKMEIGETPISTDFSATIRPFTLARVLAQNGFAVESVFAQECISLEEQSQKWLEENTGVQWVNPTNHNSPVSRGNEPELISLGFESGYYTGSNHVLGLVGDEALYGFHGFCRLMDMILDTANHQNSVKTLIDNYGLVV